MSLQNVIRLRFAFTNLACLSSAVSLSALSSPSKPLFSPFIALSLSLSLSLSPYLSTLLAIEYCSSTCNLYYYSSTLMQEVFVYLSFTLRACDGRNSHARKNLKGLSIVFYCSLSIHVTVLAHSH